MLKTWNLKKYDNLEIEKIMKAYEVSELKAKMLMFRNIDFEDIGEFLNGTLEDLKDPYGIKDMDKLVERIDKAIQNDELIVPLSAFHLSLVCIPHTYYQVEILLHPLSIQNFYKKSFAQ